MFWRILWIRRNTELPARAQGEERGWGGSQSVRRWPHPAHQTKMTFKWLKIAQTPERTVRGAMHVVRFMCMVQPLSAIVGPKQLM
jgi:hypothetical protein